MTDGTRNEHPFSYIYTFLPIIVYPNVYFLAFNTAILC